MESVQNNVEKGVPCIYIYSTYTHIYPKMVPFQLHHTLIEPSTEVLSHTEPSSAHDFALLDVSKIVEVCLDQL